MSRSSMFYLDESSTVNQSLQDNLRKSATASMKKDADANLDEMFNTLDKDRSGTLSREEFKALCECSLTSQK